MDNNQFYSNRKIMSYPRNKYIYRLIIGSRGKGKTYSFSTLLANFYQKVKHIPESDDNIDDMFVYYRLKRQQTLNMGDEILKPEVQKKHNINVEVIGNKIYFNGRHMGLLLALQDAPSHKGTNWNFRRFRFGILDEFQLERRERRTFDVVYNFRSSLESVFRFTTRIELGMDFPTILLAGNTVDDATDLLFAFDFLPYKYGLYLLKSKHAIIEYLDDGDEWKHNQSINPLNVLNVGDDLTFGERKLQTNHNLVDPYFVGHKNFIAFLHLTPYLRFEIWTTQKGYLLITKGFPTKRHNNKHFVIDRAYANKGTLYSPKFHQIIKDNYNSNNIYFDKRITAQIFHRYYK